MLKGDNPKEDEKFLDSFMSTPTPCSFPHGFTSNVTLLPVAIDAWPNGSFFVELVYRRTLGRFSLFKKVPGLSPNFPLHPSNPTSPPDRET